MGEFVKVKQKETQKQRLLKVLQQGKEVYQFMPYTWRLNFLKHRNSIDALVDLGIANLQTRIFELRQDGYNIKTIDVPHKNKYGETYFSKYILEQ